MQHYELYFTCVPEIVLAVPRACVNEANGKTRLISRVHPRTRLNFIRLLSILSTIRRIGGQLQLWEWNTLIDFAGKGFRKFRAEKGLPNTRQAGRERACIEVLGNEMREIEVLAQRQLQATPCLID